MRILIALILVMTLPVHACPDYQRMKAGNQAPCDGHFFNNDTESRIRKEVRDNELRKQQIELKDLQLQSITKDRDGWKEQAEKQAEVSHSKDNDLTKGFWYGVGLSVLIMFGVSRAVK